LRGTVIELSNNVRNNDTDHTDNTGRDRADGEYDQSDECRCGIGAADAYGEWDGI